MESQEITIGQAIDQIIDALTRLEEKSRITAINVACQQLGIVFVKQETSKVESEPPKQTEPAGKVTQDRHPDKVIDIRTLKEEKKPSSAKQMACIVAYYLKDIISPEERKDTVNAADLEKYFKQAQYPLPRQIPNVLVKAKMSGYFDDSSKGEYKLNAVGYNLVVHNLPGE